MPPVGEEGWAFELGDAVDDVTLSVGREAICIGVFVKPVNDDVPPGRYWPGGDVMRTVDAATVASPVGIVLDCGPIGVVADGEDAAGAAGCEIWLPPWVGVAVVGDAVGTDSA